MSDITERLRGQLVMSMFANSADLHAEQVRQRKEAADEIDRLRAHAAELESRLAEIEAQEPVSWLVSNAHGDKWECQSKLLAERHAANGANVRPYRYARPAAPQPVKEDK